tara:strand:+ start:569 stop:871 length:303 start_codon:yes stop_codon:yes gene_type:complete
MGFYARIPIRKVIINNGDFMIQELNQQLKSMYLEPRNKLRVDVDYVIGRIEEITKSSKGYIRESKSDKKHGYDYLLYDIEYFLTELQDNNKNHEENHNGN